MAIHPKCRRIVLDHTKEIGYGVAVADGSLINMYHTSEVMTQEVSLDVQSGEDLITGHDFLDPNDTADAWVILFQDIVLPLNNIPMNSEFVGLMSAYGLGLYAAAQIAASGDYTHTSKMQLLCNAGDQLPSLTLGALFEGSSGVNKKFTGCVVDSFTIRLTDKGRLTMDVRLITDGKDTVGSSISVPAVYASKNFLFGRNSALKYADFGSSLVDNTAKFRSFEMTWSNGILVDEAKNKTLATNTSLPEARFGDRSLSATLVLLADEDDQEYTDAKAATKKAVQLTVTGPTLAGGNTADLVIDIPEARWVVGGLGFDGTRRTLTLEHRAYNNATDGPVKITSTSRDTTYH